MTSVRALLVFAVLSATVVLEGAAQMQQDNTCGACNCQFNNIDVLNNFIDAKIDARLNTVESRINSSISNLTSTATSNFTSLLTTLPGKF